VGVAEAGNREAGAGAGESERTGGVPNLGGEAPNELESAAARAEMPGPVGWVLAPGNGVTGPEVPSSTGGGEARGELPR